MSQTFIAAYDGSAASRAAVQLAVELAAAQDAEVLAAHVHPRLPPVGLRGSVFDKQIQQDLHDQGRAVIEGLDVPGVARRALLAGSPAQALHDLAEEEHASLVVVGATHLGHIGRLTPGSVASNLLHGAPCPVLVVPSDHEPRPIRTVAVAYDEGIQAKAALEHAAQLARRFDARLEIISGYEHELFAGPAMVAAADLEELMRDDVAKRVQAGAEAITDIPVDTRVVTGPIPSALADAAEGADLLVTGSRGYGPRHSVLVGGVSRYLVDNAPCPVLVVPRVAEGAADHELAPVAAAQQPA
jgi:nucleotide-binding universal stress UspA family protein